MRHKITINSPSQDGLHDKLPSPPHSNPILASACCRDGREPPGGRPAGSSGAGSLRWDGFASILTLTLRSQIIEEGRGRNHSGRAASGVRPARASRGSLLPAASRATCSTLWFRPQYPPTCRWDRRLRRAGMRWREGLRRVAVHCCPAVFSQSPLARFPRLAVKPAPSTGPAFS